MVIVARLVINLIRNLLLTFELKVKFACDDLLDGVAHFDYKILAIDE